MNCFFLKIVLSLNKPVKEEDLLSESFKKHEESIERHNQYFSISNKENINNATKNALYNIANTGQAFTKQTREKEKNEVPLMTPAGNFVILKFTNLIIIFLPFKNVNSSIVFFKK